jgi:coenzyme F420-0:L-glutamate ligase
VNVSAIKTPIIQRGDPLLPTLRKALPRPLQERDILCIASKVVAVEQDRVVDLSAVEPSPQALAMPQIRRASNPVAYAALAELVLREADEAFGADMLWLTLKGGNLVADAGIDLSNAPTGHAILWPERPWTWAWDFRQALKSAFSLHEIGVVLTDSLCTPLRLGVMGLALAYCGIVGVENQKGKPDIFGRPLEFTQKAVADDLATAAVLVAGEAAEQIPFVLIEGAPVTFTERRFGPADGLIDPIHDLFSAIYNEAFKGAIARCVVPLLLEGGESDRE